MDAEALRDSTGEMASREIVQRALRLRRPPRLPVRFGSFQRDDTAWLPLTPPVWPTPENGNIDEWGCVWQATDVPNMGQVKGHPLLDIRRMDDYRFPQMDVDGRFKDCAAALDRYEEQGKYVLTEIFMVLFERMHSLHGFEGTLCDLIADRPAMAALADRIIEVQIEFVRAVHRRFGSRVHGIGMTDDWGTQQAGIVGIGMWREFFLPRYKRLYDLMHACGYDVWLHSCGKVNELIEGFIEAGVDAVNLLQPRALGIEEIGRRYRGRILLESSADIQTTLPTGDRARIEADVDALMAHWAGPDGGFMLCDYGDPRAIGVTSADAKLWMYRRFSQHSERLYGRPLPDPILP